MKNGLVLDFDELNTRLVEIRKITNTFNDCADGIKSFNAPKTDEFDFSAAGETIYNNIKLISNSLLNISTFVSSYIKEQNEVYTELEKEYNDLSSVVSKKTGSIGVINSSGMSTFNSTTKVDSLFENSNITNSQTIRIESNNKNNNEIFNSQKKIGSEDQRPVVGPSIQSIGESKESLNIINLLTQPEKIKTENNGAFHSNRLQFGLVQNYRLHK